MDKNVQVTSSHLLFASLSFVLPRGRSIPVAPAEPGLAWRVWLGTNNVPCSHLYPGPARLRRRPKPPNLLAVRTERATWGTCQNHRICVLLRRSYVPAIRIACTMDGSHLVRRTCTRANAPCSFLLFAELTRQTRPRRSKRAWPSRESQREWPKGRGRKKTKSQSREQISKDSKIQRPKYPKTNGQRTKEPKSKGDTETGKH